VAFSAVNLHNPRTHTYTQTRICTQETEILSLPVWGRVLHCSLSENIIATVPSSSFLGNKFVFFV